MPNISITDIYRPTFPRLDIRIYRTFGFPNLQDFLTLLSNDSNGKMCNRKIVKLYIPPPYNRDSPKFSKTFGRIIRCFILLKLWWLVLFCRSELPSTAPSWSRDQQVSFLLDKCSKERLMALSELTNIVRTNGWADKIVCRVRYYFYYYHCHYY